MPSPRLIKELFASDINRRIEEVIKVDQTDEAIIRSELGEYVVTDAIRRHYEGILDAYAEMPNKPHEGIAVWVSGFFGSGKSSFAKMLGLSIENRDLKGERAGTLFARQSGNKKLEVLISTINEKIATHAVIFDVSTDRGIRSGNQTLTEIMYGLFLQSLGYAKDLSLSELEIGLEEKGDLHRFEQEYEKLYNKKWSGEKGKVAFALSEASRVMHSLDPATYPAADSWWKAVGQRVDITPGKFAERVKELMGRRKPNHSLIFVVDEVGQFVARDVSKMLDLQAIVQNLGTKGRGKTWVVVTSQEQLGEVVSGLDDKKIELARLMDRFPLQVHLEPSDISEVTSRRVLAKNAEAQGALGKLFNDHKGRLAQSTRLTAAIKLPELTREAFIDLYPLLPYQIDLIIQVVSGLRTQGGASKHVGGANRTIIKLAQQLLVNPSVALGDKPVGQLVTLDQVYDLVEGNISSEIRAKIQALPRELGHPLAQPVAKVICLLQYVKSVHRTAENIAAALHSSVDGDSQLASVKEALLELEKAQKVRMGDDGYRIPTPAEDDWERIRTGLSPKPADSNRLYAEIMTQFWKPQPVHSLSDVKPFSAGLVIEKRDVESGDVAFNLEFAEDGDSFDALAASLRKRSQTERTSVFWALALNAGIDRQAVECYRSKEILARKERETKGEDTPALINEERARLRRHTDELRRLLREACLAGKIYFRGNDRSPAEGTDSVGKAASDVLREVLPDVFDRFKEAAAKLTEVKRAGEALFTADNLQGLTGAFGALNLLTSEKGTTVFKTDSGILHEILSRIEHHANLGETVSGRSLSEELAQEPFGWDFDVVRLLVLCLLRAGRVEATSKGQTIDNLASPEVREALLNNNTFKQMSFRPKKGIEFEELVNASEAFRKTFGSDIKELNAGAIVAALLQATAKHQDDVEGALALLERNHLAGASMLEEALGQMKAIQRGSEDNAIATFNASHHAIKEAIRRASDIHKALTQEKLAMVKDARDVHQQLWPFLQREPGLPEELEQAAVSLGDTLKRETFFKELAAIEQCSDKIQREYDARYVTAQELRMERYKLALQELQDASGWAELREDDQQRMKQSFVLLAQPEQERVPIPQLRAELAACDGRLRDAIAEVRRIIDGERLEAITINSYFADGIETLEQLEAALEGIRQQCSRLIGAGKKIIIR